MSKQRSFGLVDLFLSTGLYRKKKGTDADWRLVERMRELADKYPRWGQERMDWMLDRAAAAYGCYREEIRCDNGSEFCGKDFRQWALARVVKMRFIEPGKPSQKAFCESFNGRFRDECLSINGFPTLAMAQVVVGSWRNDYNNQRHHCGLGGRHHPGLPPNAAWPRDSRRHDGQNQAQNTGGSLGCPQYSTRPSDSSL